jgi:hypothetical protein
MHAFCIIWSSLNVAVAKYLNALKVRERAVNILLRASMARSLSFRQSIIAFPRRAATHLDADAPPPNSLALRARNGRQSLKLGEIARAKTFYALSVNEL